MCALCTIHTEKYFYALFSYTHNKFVNDTVHEILYFPQQNTKAFHSEVRLLD